MPPRVAIAGHSAPPSADVRLCEALDALLDPFWLFEAVRDVSGRIVDFRVVHANRRAAESAGLGPERVRGRLLRDISAWAPATGLVERYAAVVASGRPDVDELRVDLPDGAGTVRRWTQAVRVGDGIALTVREVTERDPLAGALPGLLRHAAFRAALAEAFARAARYGRPLALALLRVDRLAPLGDALSRRAAETALARAGGILREHVRRPDVVGRIGAEPAWLMPETSLDGACQAAERLRAAIAWAPGAGPTGLTASIGVAATRTSDTDPDEVVRRAAGALARATRDGPDRVAAAAR